MIYKEHICVGLRITYLIDNCMLPMVNINQLLKLLLVLCNKVLYLALWRCQYVSLICQKVSDYCISLLFADDTDMFHMCMTIVVVCNKLDGYFKMYKNG